MKYSGSKTKRIVGAVAMFVSVVLLLLNFIGFGNAAIVSVGAKGISPVKAFTFSFTAFAAGGLGIFLGILYILLFLVCVVLPIIVGVKALMNRKYFSPVPACVFGIIFGVIWLIVGIVAMSMGEAFSGLFGGLLNLGDLGSSLLGAGLGASMGALGGMGSLGGMTSMLGGSLTTSLKFMPTLWLVLYIACMIVTLVMLKKERVVEVQEAQDNLLNPDENTNTIRVDFDGGHTIPSRRSNLQGVAVQVRYSDDSGTHVVKRQILVGSPLTIGRSERNKLVLNDGRTSGNHASLTYDDLNGLVIEDLDSTNGIQVNGETIMRQRKINQNDSVRIGDCKLQFRVTGSLNDFDGERTIPAGDHYREPLHVRLRFTDDSGPRTENIILTDAVMIGRMRECEVFIDSTTVSHKHARLINLGKGRIAVEDNDSSNGVKVNGETIEGRAEVGTGDVILLGDVNVRVSVER